MRLVQRHLRRHEQGLPAGRRVRPDPAPRESGRTSSPRWSCAGPTPPGSRTRTTGSTPGSTARSPSTRPSATHLADVAVTAGLRGRPDDRDPRRRRPPRRATGARGLDRRGPRRDGHRPAGARAARRHAPGLPPRHLRRAPDRGRTSGRGRWPASRPSSPTSGPWSTEDPHRYRLLVTLRDADGELREATAQWIGFRSVEIVDRDLLLNGERVMIHGRQPPRPPPRHRQDRVPPRHGEGRGADEALRLQRRALRPLPQRPGLPRPL